MPSTPPQRRTTSAGSPLAPPFSKSGDQQHVFLGPYFER